MSVKRKMSNRFFITCWIISLSLIIILCLGINIATRIFSAAITQYFGGQKYEKITALGQEYTNTTYFKSQYGSEAGAAAAAYQTAQAIEEEGIVLLKNDAAEALPLALGSRITVFGIGAVDLVYGGSGSGNVTVTPDMTLDAKLTAAGYQLNPATLDFYRTKLPIQGPIIGTGNPFMGGAAIHFFPYRHAAIQMDAPETSTYHAGEVPIAEYTPAMKNSYASYQDAALIVIGRGGGEGGDLSRDIYVDMSHYNAEIQNWLHTLGIRSGQHQLQLTQNEIDLLAYVRDQHFRRVIVLINSSSAMELGFLEEPWINAALWIGSPGTAMDAIGRVLSGEVNPSGRLVDTYAYDMTADPSYPNFGHFAYSNAPGNYFVEYKEGIYVGYRYYETRYAGDEQGYRRAVQYPFGYGLSYTTFAWELVNAAPNTGGTLGENDVLRVQVRVKNTGSQPGKEVVQLYYTVPYRSAEIEKSHITLGAFAKTRLIQPGAEEIVSLSLPVRAMASYDYNDANRNSFKGWELDSGTYQIRIMRNAHDPGIAAPLEYRISGSGIRYDDDDVTGRGIKNRFDAVSSHIHRYLSRNNWEGTWPTAPGAAEMTLSSQFLAELESPKIENNPKDEAPVFGADNGVQLINLRGLDYDDPLWELLLDQIDMNEFVELVRTGAYNTAPMASVGKPATRDLDGPAGLSAYMGVTSFTAYPSACVIAATWNTQLARLMGEAVGEEGLNSVNGGVNGWYAPAMNIHRSPFAGRNFEYYSEDGVLGGEIAAAVVAGARSKGMITYIKHFALNEQETNRTRDNSITTWANEQAIREIYLRPFELAVKKGQSKGVMSSFNRVGIVWAGADRRLLNEILRDEWGFQGVVITDFNLYPFMDPDAELRAGGDFNLTMYMPPVYDKTPKDLESATAKIAVRHAVHNILYAVVNSSAMNGVAPGTAFRALTPTWVKGIIAGDLVLGLLIIGALILIVRRVRKNQAV